jgi:hypothetical protein
LAIETKALDDTAVPRGTLQRIEVPLSQIEASQTHLPTLDAPDIPTIPNPTAAIKTDDDPVDG